MQLTVLLSARRQSQHLYRHKSISLSQIRRYKSWVLGLNLDPTPTVFFRLLSNVFWGRLCRLQQTLQILNERQQQKSWTLSHFSTIQTVASFFFGGGKQKGQLSYPIILNCHFFSPILFDLRCRWVQTLASRIKKIQRCETKSFLTCCGFKRHSKISPISLNITYKIWLTHQIVVITNNN